MATSEAALTDVGRPPARRPALRHLPALDGIRAIGVFTVIAFHTGFSGIPGGFLCVESYLVLSGYLITSMLVAEWQQDGSVSLQLFWGRRARRLLPGLFTMLVLVGIGASLWPAVLGNPHLLGDTIATVFYSANWHLIAEHAEYFGGVNPSPLQHCWTLAIEEQFYLVWPLVIVLVLCGRRRRRRAGANAGDAPAPVAEAVNLGAHEATPLGAPPRARLPRQRRRIAVILGVSVVGAAASALTMAALTPVGADPTRAYYGSDTRAQGLLVGCTLAAGMALWGPVRTAAGKAVIVAIGLIGAAGTATLWATTTETGRFAYHGAFTVADLCWAAVIVSMVQSPTSVLARIVGLRPLRYVGKISYGMYLWYWIIVLVLTPQRAHVSGWGLFLARLAVDLVIASISWRFVERPVRSGSLRSWRAAVAAPAAAGAAIAAALVAATVAPAAASVPPVRPDGPRPAPSASHLPAVKVLVVGDSVAGSLGVGLTFVAQRYDVVIADAGAPDCSLSMDQLVMAKGATYDPMPPCRSGTPSALLDTWRRWVDAWNPDVVVYLAGGDLYDQEVDGQWGHIGDASFDSWLRQRFLAGVNVLGARGAHVVMLTSPVYDSGLQPDGDPWPEDDVQRVDIDDQILVAAVATAQKQESAKVVPDAGGGHPGGIDGVGGVTSFPLGSLVSPHARYATDVGGTPMRCTDGVHITISGGEAVARTLLPLLVSLGRQHQQASPRGAWPGGQLPQVPPAWWGSLGCDQ